jgi:nucleoside diphosphate kinase
MFRFTENEAKQFYAEHDGRPFFPTLIDFMTSDYAVGL